MKTREKVLLTILLAVLYSFLFGCSSQRIPTEHIIPLPENSGRDTTIAYLQKLYPIYNQEYFQNKLPETKIDLYEDRAMATTLCESGGVNCSISFNLRYVVAPRVSQFTMIHEMCHIKTWDAEKDVHGRIWRACMLQVDMQGGFRQIIIDGYGEDM